MILAANLWLIMQLQQNELLKIFFCLMSFFDCLRIKDHLIIVNFSWGRLRVLKGMFLILVDSWIIRTQFIFDSMIVKIFAFEVLRPHVFSLANSIFSFFLNFDWIKISTLHLLGFILESIINWDIECNEATTRIKCFIVKF